MQSPLPRIGSGVAEPRGWIREYADESTDRYLSFVAGRSRYRHWEWDNQRWQRDEDGRWFTEKPALDPRDMRRNGKAPDVIVSEDAVHRWGQVREARESAMSEIPDAFRGQEQVLQHNPDGSERVDYKVNLRNADGTLNKAGKALLDIHARTARIEQSAAEATKAGVQR